MKWNGCLNKEIPNIKTGNKINGTVTKNLMKTTNNDSNKIETNASNGHLSTSNGT